MQTMNRWMKERAAEGLFLFLEKLVHGFQCGSVHSARLVLDLYGCFDFLLLDYALLAWWLVERRNDTRESNNKVSTCPCTVETGDQKYDELKWESSIISEIEKQHNL